MEVKMAVARHRARTHSVVGQTGSGRGNRALSLATLSIATLGCHHFNALANTLPTFSFVKMGARQRLCGFLCCGQSRRV